MMIIIIFIESPSEWEESIWSKGYIMDPYSLDNDSRHRMQVWCLQFSGESLRDYILADNWIDNSGTSLLYLYFFSFHFYELIHEITHLLPNRDFFLPVIIPKSVVRIFVECSAHPMILSMRDMERVDLSRELTSKPFEIRDGMYPRPC